MNRPRLRTMILVPLVVTMTLGFAAFGVYLDRIESHNRLADIDDELARAELSLVTLNSSPGVEAPDAPRGEAGEVGQPRAPGSPEEVGLPSQLLVSADGEILAAGGSANPFASAVLADLSTRPGVFTVEDPRYRVRSTARPDGTVQITALALDQFDEAVADFRRALLAGGLAILALEAVLGWLLTARLVRPVAEMTAAATRIADGNLDTEIGSSGGSREISVLGLNLERMVTQLRTVIEDSERSAAQANQARNDMRRFLADVSHELRTPLTALKGYSDLYSGNMLEEPGALDRAMGRIGAESERLSVLVTDMLALAREAPAREHAENFDACNTAHSVVADLQAAHPGIPIEITTTPHAECTVYGDAYGLHQAILNVGSNACQYTDPQAGVQVEVSATGTSAVVKVIDHGPGIDPSEVDKVFLPFYRPESSRDRAGRGGAGLGLAITHQIIERFGGSISVTATPGGGATFTLTMPLALRLR